MEVYVKQVDAEGKEVLDEAGKPVLVAVDSNTLDIKEHPTAKKLLDEAVKSRQKLAALKKAASDEGEASGDDAPAKKPTAPVDDKQAEAPHIPTVDEIAAELEKRAEKRQSEKEKVDTAWNAQVEAAMTKHKLPESARSVVTEARNPENMAAALAKAPLQFANTASGGKSEEDEISDMWSRVDKRMGLEDKKK